MQHRKSRLARQRKRPKPQKRKLPHLQLNQMNSGVYIHLSYTCIGNQMSNVTEELVFAALSKVREPDLDDDLVTLKMVHDVKIEGGDVSFVVMLTTPAC